ncbi:prevent-host-death family protein [Nostoc sp. HK-01]|uniref:Prevent-host-death family protein n=2 Tax=Nostocales TaxID=1161 RepID=A0A1Z4GD31_9CYAN|nr:hypothetical protein [Nostoc cycadae]BAY15424.1 prevent-host-death family protein [Anabaenopsis circularis NIES-21]BBD60445.1 prevent-host-death family protein [Nostoc sp. HK-01]GBE93326.1 prevent-host-death protein [Nostoc cycadae WK-1]
MEKVELQLDTKTLEKALALAQSHHCDLSELFAYAIEHLTAAEPILVSSENYQELINRVNELEDMLLGQAAEVALNQSTMVGTENFTSALERLANGEA